MATPYGVFETSPIEPGYHDTPRLRHVCWSADRLRVTRLRLLSDPGFSMWDVSYCHGEIDGEKVNVILPFSQLPKRGMKRAIVRHAQQSHVFAKGLGILHNISTLT